MSSASAIYTHTTMEPPRHLAEGLDVTSQDNRILSDLQSLLVTRRELTRTMNKYLNCNQPIYIISIMCVLCNKLFNFNTTKNMTLAINSETKYPTTGFPIDQQNDNMDARMVRPHKCDNSKLTIESCRIDRQVINYYNLNTTIVCLKYF